MKILVACYTRSGNTRRVAEAVAGALRAGAEVTVEEIVDRKSRKGVLGWLGAAMDAAFGRTTEIAPVNARVPDFGLVILGTPVWCGTATPAIRAFLGAHAAEVVRAAFFCTMKMKTEQRAFAALEDVLGKAPLATLAVRERDLSKDPEAAGARVEEFAGEIARALGRRGTAGAGADQRG